MAISLRDRAFKVGKIPPSSMLRSVFPYLGKKNPKVLVKPGIGRDAAIVRHKGKVLVFSTDPITGTASHIGAHSVVINANDIATAGARPIWYLCTILLPAGSREGSLRQIMLEIDRASRALGISVIGGHTEITQGLDRPIIAGFMVGEAGKRVLSAGDGQAGDKVLFTKTAGLEGTAILASDFSEKLRSVASALKKGARGFFEQVGVAKEALAISGINGVHAIHDPTEGGVLNGLWELAEASRLGIEVDADRIPVALETKEICSALGLDPLKLMGSGSLLVAVQPSRTHLVELRLRRMGVGVSEVGRLGLKSAGRHFFRNGRRTVLEAVPRDELYRLV